MDFKMIQIKRTLLCIVFCQVTSSDDDSVWQFELRENTSTESEFKEDSLYNPTIYLASI